MRLAGNVRLVAVKKTQPNSHIVDYYLVRPGHEAVYAFSRRYTRRAYEICKNGIRVNTLLEVRDRDYGVMRLVNSTKRMLPYLVEYYEIPVAA